MKPDTPHNLIIIGSGPAGLTAAIYAARAFLNPLLIEGKKPGGQLMGTTAIENWPGHKSIMGPELMFLKREHAEHFGTTFLSGTVERVDFTKRPFTISTKKQDLLAHAVIIATGASANTLGCPGEQEYWGRGVSTCAVCDGAFYRDKAVVIVGGGDTAMEHASFMSKITDNVTVIHILPKLTASPSMQQRVLNKPTIKIIYSTTVCAIEGNGSQVTSVVLTNTLTGTNTLLSADVVFLAIGQKPNTAAFSGQLELNQAGYITLTKGTQTSQPGIFAAGDVADSHYRQAIVSAGAGCMAALDAQRYLEKEGIL